MTIKKTIFTIISFLFFFGAIALNASAATIYLLPEERTFSLGEEFTVTVGVRTPDTTINASQAIIHFPSDILELVSVDRTGSIFNFWVEEPTISNENGTLGFIGGTSKGVSGTSLEIIKLRFKTTGAGVAEITASDAIVTANDGKGTNVLFSTEETSVSVGTKKIAPPPLPAPKEPPVTPVEVPKKVIRKATVAKATPKAPKLRIPLYPDQEKWDNHSGEVVVLWELPTDVIQISTRLSKIQDKETGTKEKELFTGKNFGVLSEGVWYIRVQFKNNIGWGELAYYKISIDTTPPVSFEIETDSTTTDNPTPEIIFETQDSLSGLAETLIIIDNKEAIRTTGSSFTLPALTPREHTVLVRIYDNAGNSVEDIVKFDILPLPTPVINFVTENVARDEIVFTSGSTLPNSFVIVRVFNQKGRGVFSSEAKSDTAGNWEMVIEEPLVVGEYSLSATAKDSRGALSHPSDSKSFKIKPKPLFSIWNIDIGLFELLIILVLLVISIGSVTAWRYSAKEVKYNAYAIILGRDVNKLTLLLEKDLGDLETVHNEEEAVSPQGKAKINFIIERMRENMKKMKKYVGKEIKKLG